MVHVQKEPTRKGVLLDLLLWFYLSTERVLLLKWLLVDVLATDIMKQSCLHLVVTGKGSEKLQL